MLTIPAWVLEEVGLAVGERVTIRPLPGSGGIIVTAVDAAAAVARAAGLSRYADDTGELRVWGKERRKEREGAASK